MLKIIWEHQVSLFLKLSLLLYHPLHLPSRCASQKAEGLTCVVSCSNHSGLTPGLIDMHQDNPHLCHKYIGVPCIQKASSASTIPVRVHGWQTNTYTLMNLQNYTCAHSLWPHLPHQETCTPRIENKTLSAWWSSYRHCAVRRSERLYHLSVQARKFLLNRTLRNRNSTITW